MLRCQRLTFSSFKPMTSLLLTRFSSSAPSTELAAILQEQSLHFEQKSSKTIAFETFVQTPAEFVANGLVSIHDSLALPWWATIALATVAFRTVVGASVTIAQQRLIDRLQLVRRGVTSELEPRIRVMNIQAMQGKTASVIEERKQLRKEALHLTKRGYLEHNVHPGKLLILALFSSIPWLYFTFGIRMICLSPITLPTVSQEGTLWFQNLADVDPYGILPLAFLIPSLINISFNSIDKPGSVSPKLLSLARIQRGITRVVVIGFTLIAFKLPAGMVLFWALNSSFQLIQTLLFELPRIRNTFGLQASRFGSHPLQLRWTLWTNKWSLFFRTLKWYSKL